MEVAIASPGAAPSAVASLIPTYNPQLLLDYLVEVLKVTLGAHDKELQTNGSLLSGTRKGETLEKCRRFASGTEASQCAIYVIKELLQTEEPVTDGACTKQSQAGTLIVVVR